MRVPENVRVRVVCGDATDLSGLIVGLTVRAGRKNPYLIYFPKTDSAGVASLTRNDIVGQFHDHWEASLMDHDGTLETADPLVGVSLHDPLWLRENREAALAWPLLPHERTKWRSRQEQYRYRTSARNSRFVATPLEVDLEGSSDIVLPVERRTLCVERG